jgi:(p)ppGpp synthase/HD superfamily hydrolase
MSGHETLRRITEAFDFAAQAHTGQSRKGQAAEPYVNHVADVAARLARSPSASEAMIIAALLHDTVEDTDRTIDEIEVRFGSEVARYVAEVTDDMSLDKVERRRRQVQEAQRKSDGAKRIKLADKASNLTALAGSPPHLWSVERKREYLAWAREVADGLRGVDPLLDREFDEAAARAEKALSQSP